MERDRKKISPEGQEVVVSQKDRGMMTNSDREERKV